MTAESIIENALKFYMQQMSIFEPREDSILVRFRINGALKNINEFSKEMSPKIIKYFKHLGGLNFSEKNFSAIFNDSIR